MRSSFLFIFLTMLTALSGQVRFSSIQDVFEFADQNAIEVASGLLNEQMAEQAKNESNSNMLPRIEAVLSYNDNIQIQPALVPANVFNPNAEEGQFEELAFGTRFNYAWGIQAQWDILNFQKIMAANAAGKDLERIKSQSQLSRFNTYNQLASTYYSILLIQESIKIYRENEVTSKKMYLLSKDKFENGLISDVDLNKTRINWLQNKSKLSYTESNLNQYLLQFQSQLNTSEEIEIQDSPKDYRIENINLSTQHPQLAVQEAEINSSEAQVKQQKAARLPSLSLVYENNRSYASDDFFQFDNSYEIPQQFFGVQMSINLFALDTRSRIQRSKTELHLKELELENLKLVKRNEDDVLLLQLGQAADQLQEYQTIFDLQKKNDNHAQKKFEQGILSLDQRLSEYDDLLLIQDQYLQSLASFTLANYKILIRQMDFKTQTSTS